MLENTIICHRPFPGFSRESPHPLRSGNWLSRFLGLALSIGLFFVPAILSAQETQLSIGTPATADTPQNADTPPRADAVPAGQALASPSQSDSYILRDNDLIRITVFEEDDLTTETRISKSGYITFPLLGPVRVGGKSIAEATADIRTRLDKDYVINPHVTLTLLQYAQQWVTILGEVQKPGRVEIPPEGGLDLLGGIALAGGYTRVADPSNVIVRRVIDGHDVVLRVNAKKLARDTNSQQFLLQPEDRVSVGESLF
jgi:polysaccharide export outer membrane protein